MQSKPIIVLRADGNNSIGLGHVYRLLSLAGVLKGTFELIFVTASINDSLAGEILAACDKLVTIESESDFFNLLTLEHIVVIDGYSFTADYRQRVQSLCRKLVYIDDLQSDYRYADVIINHALNAVAKDYHVHPEVEVFAGRDYIMLRDEFYKAANERGIITSFDTVFVCFGGADNIDLTYTACTMLASANIKHVHVLLGAAYAHNPDRFAMLASGSGLNITVHQRCSPKDIITLLRKCGLAIVSASSVAYECAAVGLPLLVGYYVEHQHEFYRALTGCDNVVGMGAWPECTAEKLREGINGLVAGYTNGAKSTFIDGKQPVRLLKIFKDLSAR